MPILSSAANRRSSRSRSARVSPFSLAVANWLGLFILFVCMYFLGLAFPFTRNGYLDPEQRVLHSGRKLTAKAFRPKPIKCVEQQLVLRPAFHHAINGPIPLLFDTV